MNIAGAVVIFVIVWWLVFFALLPMGVTSRWEGDGDGVDGAEPGAPMNPDLKRKAVRATLIAAALTVVIVGIIMSGVINFRE
ncbi:MAG: DUF1467 family protein [Pseudomonadota bacterium]